MPDQRKSSHGCVVSVSIQYSTSDFSIVLLMPHQHCGSTPYSSQQWCAKAPNYASSQKRLKTKTNHQPNVFPLERKAKLNRTSVPSCTKPGTAFHMEVQTVFLSKLCFAMWTHVRLFTRMDPFMHFQIVGSSECFPADSASMGVLPGMGFDVSPLSQCWIKHFGACGTGENLSAKVDAISMQS